jgi:hypothetical protein
VKLVPTWHRVAASEWISSVALRTAADGVVVHNLAASVLSASAWARVSALLVQAGLLQRALGA